jgi:hypothetical protein
MKLFLALLMPFLVLSANDKVYNYAPSEDCMACHSKIHDEFTGSMHANSTPQKDPIHASVWEKHPQNIKQERYGCGKCHTPAADNLDKMKTKGEKALPLAENRTHQEGISCAYCHRIESIALHKKHNTNIISSEEKNYFGTLKNTIKSPYHGIKTENNIHIQNGNVCIGCHSHKMNKHGLNVCSTNIDNALNIAYCGSFHMTKVSVSVSDMHETEKHAFHGFAGSHFHSNMLTQYVDISLLRQIDNFIVNIDNRTSHALLLHPLRQAVLKVSVQRAKEIITLKEIKFARVIGHNGKPAMPWAATETVKNTMIQANEKRSIIYDFKIQKGDRINIVLGWFLVNPKVVDPLHLQKVKVATEFHEFKTQNFQF